MEAFKSITVNICILSLVFSLFGGLCAAEKYASTLRVIFIGITILCVIKPIASGELSFYPLFESENDAEYNTYGSADEVIDEAVRLQAHKNIEECACQILSDYEIEYEDLIFDVNIDDFGCISISNISLKSDSPLTAEYALKKLFGDNAEIEVTEIE